MKLSRKELAELVGCNHRTIGWFENGKREISLRLAIKLSKELDLSIEQLLEKDEENEN